MMPAIPRARPERDEAYAAVRESLARALEDTSKQIWRLHDIHLAERLTGDAPTTIEHCAFLLKSRADELRDRDLVDLHKVHDALDRAAVALGAGIFLIRNLQGLLCNFPSR